MIDESKSTMSYREKVAWGAGIVLALAGGYYAWQVIGHGFTQNTVPPPSIKLVLVYVAIVIIGSIFIGVGTALQSSEEDIGEADEREQVILDRAGRWSGRVLMACALAGVFHYWSYQDGHLMFHWVVGGLMISQFAECILLVFYFRRGV